VAAKEELPTFVYPARHGPLNSGKPWSEMVIGGAYKSRAPYIQATAIRQAESARAIKKMTSHIG
jgi:hypothetical protein